MHRFVPSSGKRTEVVLLVYTGLYPIWLTAPPAQWLLTNSLSREFIRKEYGGFLETFDSYPFPVQRADAIRYFVLDHYGGIYLDLDDGCARRLEIMLEYPAWLRRSLPTGIGNDALGSVPHHPFIKRVIESLENYAIPSALPCINFRSVVNDARATRVADLLSDFRALQYSIVSVTCDSPRPDGFYTEGYAALRQCSVDGQHVLNVAADTRVPTGRSGPAEQEKAELTQVLLDSFSRRHEAQKICMRQSAAMRWVAWRDSVLLRPDPSHVPALVSGDQALRAELATVTDENIYNLLRNSD
ncbi:hypothetical protein VE01_05574 [Pseudogymnoascus verrucosus]|uniref:Uncharacterized protein n=1 Tax=Pseudogymnoascus verrucosus TaxID=342668 RepID=A0A1B8GM78_9PEZI|nr:uncharacterized protein VE01_05574 [Pseudogymnoascus verrucosus]OBT96944.1 hypothetical protein VE01_05574 [Pseudogymnoascus verrucosus]